MSQIVDRQWGSQVVNKGMSPNRACPAAWLLAVVVSDAACVARMRGWQAVSVGVNVDGRLGLTCEVQS